MKNILRLLILALLPMMAMAAEKPTVKIGVILPLSGNEAFYGEGIRNALSLWVEEHPEAAGSYKFIFEDDGSEMSRIALASRKLLNVDKVDVLLSAFGRRATIASPLAEKLKVPNFTFGTWKSRFTEKDPYYTFVTGAVMEPEVELFIQACKALGYKKLGYIGWQTPDGVIMTEYLLPKLEAAGFEMVAPTQYEESMRDFRTMLLKIDQGKPDALIFIGFSPHMPIVLRQWKEIARNKAPVVTIEGFDDLHDNELTQNHWYVTLSPSDSKFIQDFQKRFGAAPSYGSNYAYDIMTFIDIAVEKQRTTGDISGEAMAKALHEIPTLKGVSGHWNNPPSGVMFSTAQLYLINNNTASFTTAEELAEKLKNGELYK